MPRILKWDRQVVEAFRKIIFHIKKDSPQNADKVKIEVLNKMQVRYFFRINSRLTNTKRIMTVLSELLNCIKSE